MTMSTACARFSALAIVVALGACAGGSQTGGSAADAKAAAKEAIWAKEQAVYAARRRADPQYYVDNASDHYLGWPPGWTTPSGIDQLRSGAAQMCGMNQEEITLELDGISFDGNTAISFFSTHRTRMPDGEVVDQRYENIHVWVYGNGQWRLLSSMGRPVT